MRRTFWKPGNAQPEGGAGGGENATSATSAVDQAAASSGEAEQAPRRISSKLSSMKFMARAQQSQAREKAEAKAAEREQAAHWSFDVPSAEAPASGTGGTLPLPPPPGQARQPLLCVPDTESTLGAGGEPSWAVAAGARHSFRNYNAALQGVKAQAAAALGHAKPTSEPKASEAEAIDEDEMLEQFLALRSGGGSGGSKRAKRSDSAQRKGSGKAKKDGKRGRGAKRARE